MGRVVEPALGGEVVRVRVRVWVRVRVGLDLTHI